MRPTSNVKNTPITSVSRRQFLLASAAAAGAGIAQSAGSAEQRSPGRRGGAVTQADYDVIVVGGGFSGVTAARDCQKNGLRTLVLEAKSRLGGRTFDTKFRDHHIELGGTWVHWAQPAVWSEILRYGIPVEETPGAVPERVVAIVDGRPTSFETGTKIEEIVQGVESYFAESSLTWPRPYDSQFAWKEIVARSAMSTADRLKAVRLSPLQRDTLVPFLEAMGHCPLDKASYVEMMRWWSLSLDNFGNLMDVTARYKMPGGTGALARIIAADGGAELRLNAPVRRIEKRGEVLAVSTQDGKSLTARAVILALPPRVLSSIDIVPALSELKLEASRQGFTPSGMKYYVEVKGHLGKVQWLAPAKQRAGMLWTYAELPSTTLLVGFAPENAFDPNDEESVQAVLRQFDPQVEVLASTSYAWSSDPFARGTYSGFAPGGLVRYHAELSRHEGRLYMAGGDVGDNSWRGFIDGAIARGARVAREVSESLLT